MSAIIPADRGSCTCPTFWCFVTIQESHVVSDLLVLKSKLEFEGIKCFLKNEHTTQIMSHMATFVAELQVSISDLERVHEILKKNEKNNYLKLSGWPQAMSLTVLQRAVERDLAIIGEVIRKMNKINPKIKNTASKNIIGLRNIISHAYNSVKPHT